MDNLKVIENLLRSYIEKNFVEGVEEPKVTMQSASAVTLSLTTLTS